MKIRSTATIVALSIILLPAVARALDIKRSTLSNGAILLVSEQHQLPMVTVSIAFDAGERRDPKGKEGLASLTARCLTQGTRQLSAQEFDQKVDFMGSALAVGATRDYASAAFTSLDKYVPETLKLLAGVLTEPGLRDADIERKRAEQIAGIRSEEQQPGYIAGVAFAKGLYDDGPYGHPGAGTAESVAKLTPDDVRGFYRQYYKPGSAVIAVTGDISGDEVKPMLEKALAALKGSVPPQPEPAAAFAPKGLDAELIDRNFAQATIMLGFGGVSRSNPDYYKLQVMNYILGGGGFASRLMRVVRSKAGLAYGISSAFEAALFPGPFVIDLQTKNQSANEAIKLVLEQMREIQQKPVTDAEMDNTKKFLIGSFPLKIDRQSAIASFMLQVQLYGLGLDYADKYPEYIRKVTKQDALEVARKYLHPDSMLLVAVANQSEAAINTAMLTQVAEGANPGK